MSIVRIAESGAHAEAAGELMAARRIIAEQTRLISIQHAALVGVVHKFGHICLAEEVRIALGAIAQAEGRTP